MQNKNTPKLQKKNAKSTQNAKNAKTIFFKYNLGVRERLSTYNRLVYAASVHVHAYMYSQTLLIIPDSSVTLGSTRTTLVPLSARTAWLEITPR
jgi:hypothetical protein